MGTVNPSLYRRSSEIDPHTNKILSYLGQAGADSVYILNLTKPELFQVYAPYVRSQNNDVFVDYTKPRINAFHDTFVVPKSLAKKTLKSGEKANQLASFVSLIAGTIIFASLYMVVRDCKIISNSRELIINSQKMKKFLDNSPEFIDDAIYKSLEKVAQLREIIYKRNHVSAIVSLAMTVTIIALSVFAIGAAIVGAYPLLIASTKIVGALLLGHCIKAIVEWKGRLDKQAAEEVLEQTEIFRLNLLPILVPL